VGDLDGCSRRAVAIPPSQSPGLCASAKASHSRASYDGTSHSDGVRNLDGCSRRAVAILLGQSLLLSAKASHNRTGDSVRNCVRDLNSRSSILLGNSLGLSADTGGGRVSDSDGLGNSSSVSRSRVNSARGVAESERLGLDVGGGYGLRSHDDIVGMPSVGPGRNRRRVDARGRRNSSGAVLRYDGGRRRGDSRRVGAGAVFVRHAGGRRRGKSRGVDDGAVLEHARDWRRGKSRRVRDGAVLIDARGRRRDDGRRVGDGDVLVRCAGGVRRGHSTARGSERSRPIGRSRATESRAHVDGAIVLDELANLILEVTDA
jgi:hypothetical protein